jgi:hypothetical protein
LDLVYIISCATEFILTANIVLHEEDLKEVQAMGKQHTGPPLKTLSLRS